MDQTEFVEAVRPLVDHRWLEPTVALLDETMRDSASHDFGHLLRVINNADRIARGESERGAEVDREALMAAALLHDLVDLPKDDPERHLASRRSAEEAVAHYEDVANFDDERLSTIEHAISAHSFSAGIPAETLEAKILTDADRLDALGALGVARCFYVL
ncbi:MAG: HD domain-containing protein, partial [Persicimonas sp.]